MTEKPQKYSLFITGRDGWETVMGAPGEAPRDTFQKTIERMGLKEEDAYSFWKVGQAFRQDSVTGTSFNSATVSMWDRHPGEELIFDVRDLPEISKTAQAVLSGFFFSPKSTLNLGNRENRLSDQARDAFDELISAGLLCEEEGESGPPSMKYSLSEEGRAYPRGRTTDFMREHGEFPLTSPIENDNDTSPSL